MSQTLRNINLHSYVEIGIKERQIAEHQRQIDRLKCECDEIAKDTALKSQKLYEKIEKIENYSNRKSKCIISRNDYMEILYARGLTDDIVNYMASFHPHPIDEFIGKDALVFQYYNLKFVAKHPYSSHHERFTKERFYKLYRRDTNAYDYQIRERYNDVRQGRIDYINRKLSTEWRLHRVYPFAYKRMLSLRGVRLEPEFNMTKEDIVEYADACGIKLYISWTKDKMIKEFYKNHHS